MRRPPVQDDPRRCGIAPAPLKTTVVPRICSSRVRRSLFAAWDRADAPTRRQIEQQLNGAIS